MDTKNIVRSLWEPITTFQILLLLEFWFYLRSWCLPNSSKCPDNLCLYSIIAWSFVWGCCWMLVARSGHASSIFTESLAVAPSRHRCSHHHHPCVAKDLIWSKQQAKHHQDLMKTCQMWPDVSSSCSKHNGAVVCYSLCLQFVNEISRARSIQIDMQLGEANRAANLDLVENWLVNDHQRPPKSLQVIGIETQHVGLSRIYGTALSNLRPWVLKSCWFELAQGVV